MTFLDADYAAIESRIVCWLAGQEDALEEYRRGVDRYVGMASLIYRVPIEQVNKHPQRFVGKQTILGCIAEGELVLTDAGLVPIEKVSAWQRVWDGVEWVHHEGLIYQGEKEVITYDGLTATPDHIVFAGVESPRPTDLWSAREQKLGLTLSGEGRTPIRTMEAADESSFPQPRGIPMHESSLRVRRSNVSRVLEFEERREQRLRCLFTERPKVLSCSTMVGETHGGGERQMSEFPQQKLSQLRRTRDQIPIQISSPWSKLGFGQLGFLPEPEFGSQEQRWSLRTREFEIRDSTDAGAQLPNGEVGPDLQSIRMALLQIHHGQIPQTWDDPKTSFGSSSSLRSEQVQTMAGNSKKIRTYDLMNAGPRHRFTVSGKLVHNCGFGMGPPKFRNTCWTMGRYDLPKGLEFTAVEGFRAKHKKVVSSWYDTERAAKNAILKKGSVFLAGKHLRFVVKDLEGTPFLLMRLPSGRKLAYPRPRLCGDRIAFFGNVKGATWGDVFTWGGTLVENATQAVAADVMAHGSHNAERSGYEIATLIHDQALAYHGREQTSDEFVRLLTDLPSWADGLPIEAEGAVVPFYKKD